MRILGLSTGTRYCGWAKNFILKALNHLGKYPNQQIIANAERNGIVRST